MPSPQLDTATARGDNLVTDDFSATDIDVDAHSGPSGENPGGTASFDAGGILPISGPVTCLDISGNTAVMTVEGPFPARPGYSAFTVRLVDNGGSGMDRFEYFPVLPEMPVDCRTGSSAYFGGLLIGRAVVFDAQSNTTITGGPSGSTNDPTPTFTFSASGVGSSFECKVDSGSYTSCGSPKTTAHLTDGSHTFYVRAVDPAGNRDPNPATRTFTVKTASIGVSGSNLVVTAASGAKDNLAISRPSFSTLKITDLSSGPGTGSGVHVGEGCTRSGDFTATCSATEIARIGIASGDQADRVINSTRVPSSLYGGKASDTLIGGSRRDSLIGGPGADVMVGMNGNDQLFARDGTSDTTINCDGGTASGTADKAELDLLPKDVAVSNCESKTRHRPGLG